MTCVPCHLVLALAAASSLLTTSLQPAQPPAQQPAGTGTAPAATSAARTTTAPRAGGKQYDVRDVMVPARDGVKLHTKIFTPRDARGPDGTSTALPFLLTRTPYGIEGAANRLAPGGAYQELADDGYLFVFQDLRGRHRSEGTFVMQRPKRDPADVTSIDEATDAHDTISWLLAHTTGHNGRAGMLGVSYDGWTTAMALCEPHEALRAASPQASPADMWLGDDFHHNGAFRLSYGFEYAALMETTKQQAPFEMDRADTFDWYLALGSLANVNQKHLHGKIPTWNDFVAHPDYDEFWQRQTLIPRIQSATVPALHVAGWWDQEDFYGPMQIYQAFERHDTKGHNHLVVGPWNHGGWSRGTGQKLGALDFGSATAAWFREHVQVPWFAHWLKDRPRGAALPEVLSGAQPEALTFEAGSNAWRRWDAWPPKGRTTDRPLYFHAGERLAFERPDASSASACDSYLSDPAHPVPYRHRPIQATYARTGSGWSTWLTEDQRFVDDRPDLVSWETPPLDEDLTIAGEVIAELRAATTGSDADWIVKLIDVYPEKHPSDPKMAGYQLMVSSEVFRGRYRNSFAKPEPVAPGAVTRYRFSLGTQSYAFRKGHRVMVQVQSTWFPLIDRNPQTFVPNIFAAKDADYRAATHTIWRSQEHASHVVLPVLAR